MPIRTVKLEDPHGTLKKLNWNFLVQPEMQDILGSATRRMERQGKGKGAQRNTITATVQPLMARATTTLNPPRTVGSSYRESQRRRFLPPVLRNSTKKAIGNVLKRWSS